MVPCGLCRPPTRDTLALHDAQFVIAREYGFKSWNDLRDETGERSLSFSAAVDEFVRCATGDAKDRALRLLARHGAIAHANLFTELVLGDAAAVEGRLKGHAELAVRPGGVQNWEPLLYVCHTCLHRGSSERADGLVRIARELIRQVRTPTPNTTGIGIPSFRAPRFGELSLPWTTYRWQRSCSKAARIRPTVLDAHRVRLGQHSCT